MSPSFVRLSLAVAALAASLTAQAMGSRPRADDEAVNARIAPVARVEIAEAKAAATSGARSGEELYKAACAACHDSGAANAPKLGDKAAWARRIGRGVDDLLKSAIQGRDAMPPRGGSDATDAELARAVVYMANKAGAGFKEPGSK